MANILICDDSWLTRRGVKRIVQDQGHNVIEVENGRDGLAKIRQTDTPIDAVFLDLLMPEMSGIEFLEALQKDQIDIPVIVLTADIQETVKVKCNELGAKAFLNKPPNPESLVSALNDALA